MPLMVPPLLFSVCNGGTPFLQVVQVKHLGTPISFTKNLSYHIIQITGKFYQHLFYVCLDISHYIHHPRPGHTSTSLGEKISTNSPVWFASTSSLHCSNSDLLAVL
jgi:hypothetical protein